MEKEDWLKNTPEEIDFWQQWFDTKGLYWPPDYVNRLNPDFEIDNEFKLMFGPRLPKMKILDAGCGPLTILGTNYCGGKLDITCCDALADSYNEMMENAGITPLIKPRAIPFESLQDHFGKIFDFVHAVNCVDHCHDPLAAIKSMMSVLSKHGVLYLRHGICEGNRGNYEGLHQWDFYCNEKRNFIIADKHGNTINVDECISKDEFSIRSTVPIVPGRPLITTQIVRK